MQDTLRCLAPSGDRCGEGAVWSAGENAVYWTDINRFLIHRYDLASTSIWSGFVVSEIATTGSSKNHDRKLVLARS